MTAAAERAGSAPAPRALWRGRALVIALVAGGFAAFLAANAHFLYVAIMSQPECISHSKEPRSAIPGGLYQAAKPAC